MPGADRPPPRRLILPPPLPGSLTGEPFLRANTPPSGGVEPLPADPRDGMILDLQRELVLLRERATDSSPPLADTRPSVRMRRAAIAKGLGKWAVALTLLPLIGGVVAKRWPEYAGIVDVVLQALGLR